MFNNFYHFLGGEFLGVVDYGAGSTDDKPAKLVS